MIASERPPPGRSVVVLIFRRGKVGASVARGSTSTVLTLVGLLAALPPEVGGVMSGGVPAGAG